MEEVKSKERQMNSMQRELSGQMGQMAMNQIEKEAIEKRLMDGKVQRENGIETVMLSRYPVIRFYITIVNFMVQGRGG